MPKGGAVDGPNSELGRGKGASEGGASDDANIMGLI